MSLSQQLHHLLAKTRQQMGDDMFISGACAALALVLCHYSRRHAPTVPVSLCLIYRHECEQETNEEILHTLSHVVACIGSDEWDIYGENAYDRWQTHVDDFDVEPGCYNELKGQDVDPFTREGLQVFALACADFGLSLDAIPSLCELWQLPPWPTSKP